MLCEKQDAKEARDGKAKPEGGATPELLIEQDGVGVEFEREGDGLRLTGIEVCGADGDGNGGGGADFKPRREGGMGPQEFGAHCGRDEHPLEKRWQQVGVPGLQEGGNRGGVADDEHFSAARAELCDGGEILRQILGAVVDGDFSAAQFVEKLSLAEVGDFGGLAERDFAGGVKADGEVQRRLLGRERRFQRRGQGDVHGAGRYRLSRARTFPSLPIPRSRSTDATRPMNTRTILTALLAAGAAGANLTAQEPATAAPQTEMQKWIATTDAQWQDAFKKGVADMHEADLNKVKLQYLNLLEGAIDKASKANDLKGAVALRDEQKRFGDTQHFPEQDDAADAAAVKQVRAAIRAQLAKANADRDARAKALHAKYDQFLAQTQTQLTQAKRLDDALLVQAKREEVKGMWVAPRVTASIEKVTPTVVLPVTGQKPPTEPKSRSTLAKVSAHDTNLKALKLGAEVNGTKVNGTGACTWVSIPDSLQGYQFTHPKRISVPLRFTVETDGLVYLACTSDFGKYYSGGTWQQEVVAETELLEKGWRKQTDLILRDTDEVPGHHVWWVYVRECKAGEKFSYRTTKYAPPILLVK